MLEVEMRVQREHRDLPPAVLYDVGTLRLIIQDHIDAWLNGHWSLDTLKWAANTNRDKNWK